MPTMEDELYKKIIHVKELRRTCVKLIVYAFFILLVLIVTIIPFLFEYILSNNLNLSRKGRYSTDLKYILFWEEEITDKKRFGNFNEGQSMFANQKCEYINCFISMNKSLLNNDVNNFNAIVFDIRDIIDKESTLSDLQRSPDQIYIFRSMDPSDYFPVCDPKFEDFFNWTWTYKLDSDIPVPFFYIYDQNETIVGPKKDIIWKKLDVSKKDYRNKFTKKSKPLAWIIPKCRTKKKHYTYFKELDITLDMYGACTQRRCSDGNILKCYEMVERDYYFQLVLEASTTEDYVTEKILKPMEYFSVPILFGDTDYSKFFPPGSYINAKGLRPEILAEIIESAIQTPNVYEEFFAWKSEYFYRPMIKNHVCDLCSKLNSNYKAEPQNSFRKWWNPSFNDFCTTQQLYQKLLSVKIQN